MAGDTDGIGYIEALRDYFTAWLKFLRRIPSYTRSLPRKIRTLNCRNYFKYLPGDVREKSFATVVFFLSFILAIVAFSTFEIYQLDCLLYCLALCYCSGITLSVSQGHWYIKKLVRGQQDLFEELQADDLLDRERADEAQPLQEDLGNALEPEFPPNAAEELNQPSTSAGSSCLSRDKLLGRIGSSDSGNNLPQFTSDPASPSTCTTPLQSFSSN